MALKKSTGFNMSGSLLLKDMQTQLAGNVCEHGRLTLLHSPVNTIHGDLI